MPNTINTDGTILRDATSRYRRAKREDRGAHGAFDGETRRAGGAPRAEVNVRRDTAPPEVATLLGIDAGTQVVVRERRMYDGDRLVQLADTYIPTDVAEAAGIEQVDTGVGGIISRMKEAGFEQAEVIEDVTQRPATTQEAEVLRVKAGDQLLTITHLGRTTQGRAIEATLHRLAPGWTLRFNVPLD